MFDKILDKNRQSKLLGLLFFFFNTVGLPAPITFTSLLSLIRVKQAISRYKSMLLAFAVIVVVYSLIHYVQGVVLGDLILSQGFYMLLIFSGLVAFDYLRSSNVRFGKLFEWLSLVAIVLFGIGLILLFTPVPELLWTNHVFVGGGVQIERFKGLSHEPSHLAFSLCPIFLYLFWKFVCYPSLKTILYLFAVGVPIAFTLSFGFAAVWAISTLITLLLILLIYGELKKILIIPVVLVTVGAIGINLFENPISNRVEKIILGEDTSVNGRTYEAFMLAHECAELKNIWFGIGMGQIKHIGEEVIRPYYQSIDPSGYDKEIWPVLRIPNSLAETLAIYGYSGVLLKIGFLILCFFRFKVYNNYFSLSLFLFVFFYQMMGSFILSSAEVIIWALVFAKVFPEFKLE